MRVSATAIHTRLHRHGLDPAPRRTATTWRAFLCEQPRESWHVAGDRLEETRAFPAFLRDEIPQVMAKWRARRTADPAK